jgi:CubicO group peptidase (beta-lactamase class C family)
MAGGPGSARDDWQPVASALAELAGDTDFSGVALAVQGGEPVLEFTHGLADRSAATPVHAGTRFGLASLCKMFTAAAVLDAVGEGLLGLDTPVVELLPRARRPRTLDPRVTPHHLLTHTSGMGDYAEEDEDLPGYVEDYASIWRDVPSSRMERVDDFLPLYTDLPPVDQPGTYHYCNSGFLVLGAVLEEVTGEEFTARVTRRVLEPAGMVDSGYFRLDEPRPDLATGYLRGGPPDAPWRSNVYSVPVVGGPDGGCFATARDVDRFLRAVADGSLLGPELTSLMRTPHVQAAGEVSCGYGLFVRPDGSFGHPGGDPGVRTASRHLPAQGLSLVLLCNGEDLVEEAWDLLLSAAASASRPRGG